MSAVSRPQYVDIDGLYDDALGSILPVPAGAKFPPPAGFTGKTGQVPDTAQRQNWAPHTGNFALRLAPTVVGIDVDHYGDKVGGDTLKQLEAQLGPLPPTYRIRRRGVGTYLFRYPGGPLQGSAGPDIDVVQHDHRYTMVWPSAVPDDAGTMLTYKWLDGDGKECDPPAYVDLAELPKSWVDHLSGGKTQTSGHKTRTRPGKKAVASRASAQMEDDDEGNEQFRADMFAYEADMSEQMELALDKALATWDKLEKGSHHDSMMHALYPVLLEGVRGFAGCSEAIGILRDHWLSYGEPLGRGEAEFDGMLDWTLKTLIPGFRESVSPSFKPIGPLEAKRHSIKLKLGKGKVSVMDWSGGETEIDADRARKDGPTYQDSRIIYSEDPVLSKLGFSTMNGQLAWRGGLPPWRSQQAITSIEDTFFSNQDEVECKRLHRWYYGDHHRAVSEQTFREALEMHAFRNEFSPLVDYLEGLPAWDGVDRIATAIPTVEDPGDYTEQTFLNFFLGFVQRAYEPGSQVDSALVLVGGQGLRKTSWLRAISPFNAVELSGVPDASHDKDALSRAYRGSPVIFDEIDKLRRRDDQSALKAFITGRTDSWRPPYARTDVYMKRSFVITGTTNDDNFLIDTTGNRRYWVLKILERIPAELMTRDHMDLLLAEARDRYKRGERIRYDEAYEQQAEQRREAHIHDPIGEAIESWLEHPVSAVLWGQDAPQVMNTTVLTVGYLAKHCAALNSFDPLRDRRIADQVRDYLNSREDYFPVTNIRVDGQKARRGWHKFLPGLIEPSP